MSWKDLISICRRPLLAAALLFTGLPLLAQPIKPEILQATNVDALLTMVGAAKAQNNGRLSLEFSDIATRGPLNIKARSEMPGTVSMLVLVGAPTGWYGSGLPGDSAPRPPAAAVSSKPALVVLKAWQVPPGAKPELNVTYTALEQRQAFTFLAFAQGRWNMVVREVKLACSPDQCPKRSLGAP